MKILIVGMPRSGTTYLTYNINTNKNIDIMSEPFHMENFYFYKYAHKNKIKEHPFWLLTQKQVEDLENNIFTEDSGNFETFFNKLCKYQKEEAQKHNIDNIGMKVVYENLPSKYNLKNILNQFDSCIIIKRDPKEIIYSYFKAYILNSFEIQKRKASQFSEFDTLSLSDEVFEKLSEKLISSVNFISQVQNHYDNLLIVNYGDIDWECISQFTNTDIKENIKYNKFKYDYKKVFDRDERLKIILKKISVNYKV